MSAGRRRCSCGRWITCCAVCMVEAVACDHSVRDRFGRPWDKAVTVTWDEDDEVTEVRPVRLALPLQCPGA